MKNLHCCPRKLISSIESLLKCTLFNVLPAEQQRALTEELQKEEEKHQQAIAELQAQHAEEIRNLMVSQCYCKVTVS